MDDCTHIISLLVKFETSSFEVVVSRNFYFEGPEAKSLTSREHSTENDVSDYSRIFSYKCQIS